MYPYKVLMPIYQYLLRLSAGRGEHTLAKLDALMFRSFRGLTISSTDTATITLPPDPHFFRYLTKSHEQHVSNAISKLATRGGSVIDVGANIGYFAAYAAATIGRQGKVFCFEPAPLNFYYLQKNCASLQKQGFDCFANQLAVGSHVGTAILNLHRHSTYHALEDALHSLDQIEKKVQVKTVSLDEWAKTNKISDVCLVKIDTEGYEAKVLEGARTLYETRSVGVTVLECRSNQVATLIDDFCQEFRLYQLIWNGDRWISSTLQSSENKVECILSRNPISPAALC